MGKAKKLKELRKIEQQNKQVEHSKKRKKIELIIVGILLLLVVGGVALTYLNRTIKEKNMVSATIQTDKGNIELTLDKNAAPNTVENFVKLAQSGFYDGVKFHRVVDSFVIQAGDPLSKDEDPSNDGQGGPGYAIDDEINPKSLGLSQNEIDQLVYNGYTFDYSLTSLPHKVGTISMANSGPNTAGSQFFIVTTEDQPDLNGKYTAFGNVTSGMDVVRQIKQGDIINKVVINE